MVKFVVEGDRAVLGQLSEHLQGLGIPNDDWSSRPISGGWSVINHHSRTELALVPAPMKLAPFRIVLQRIVMVDGNRVIQEVDGHPHFIIKYTLDGRVMDPSISEIAAQVLQVTHLKAPTYTVDAEVFKLSIQGSKGVYIVYPVAVLGSLIRSLGSRAKFIDYAGGPLVDNKGARIFIGIPEHVGCAWELWKRGFFVLNGEIDERYLKSKRIPENVLARIRDIISAGATASTIRVGDNGFYELVNDPTPKIATGQLDGGGQSYPTLVVIAGKGSGKSPAVIALRMAGVETYDSDDYLTPEQSLDSRKAFMAIMAMNQSQVGWDKSTEEAVNIWYLNRCALIRESVIKTLKTGTRQAYFFHNMAEMLSCHAFIDYKIVVLDVAPEYGVKNVQLRGRDVEFELPLARFLWKSFVVPANAQRVLPNSMIRVCLASVLIPSMGARSESRGSGGPPRP